MTLLNIGRQVDTLNESGPPRRCNELGRKLLEPSSFPMGFSQKLDDLYLSAACLTFW